MRRVAIVAIVCAFVAGLLTTAVHADEAAMSVVVGADPADDWEAADVPNEKAVGDALAQELVQARIGMADSKTVNFIIVLKSLPSTGGVPEFTRYTWEMLVDSDGEMTLSDGIRLDGKFTNYHGEGGTCDPWTGGCPPPRDPGMAPFLVYSDCDPDAPTVCTEEGIVRASFDVDEARITIPVPLKMLGARPGSEIVTANSFFGGIMAMPAAYGSLRRGPSDQMFPRKPFVIPREAG